MQTIYMYILLIKYPNNTLQWAHTPIIFLMNTTAFFTIPIQKHWIPTSYLQINAVPCSAQPQIALHQKYIKTRAKTTLIQNRRWLKTWVVLSLCSFVDTLKLKYKYEDIFLFEFSLEFYQVRLIAHVQGEKRVKLTKLSRKRATCRVYDLP